MKKQMNVILTLLIVILLVLTLGRYLAGLFYDDPETVDQMVKLAVIFAVIYVPLRHFRMKRNYRRK